MVIVIDTNILLISISSKSKYHWLYQLVLNEHIQIAFSSEILAEYEEQIGNHWHPNVANSVLFSLIELPSAINANVYYNLNLVSADADDNKFVDCAFAANADYIVTNDSHFNILKEIEFPIIPVLKLDQFYELLKRENLL